MNENTKKPGMKDRQKGREQASSAPPADHEGRVPKAFLRRLEERFFLRFHMSLILLATALTGVLSAWLMLLLDLKNIVIRYPLAVLIAYLAFFLFVKLWLKYLTASRPLKGLDTAGDLIPDLHDLSGGGGGGTPSFSGGGGESGGGGATGAFDGPAGNTQAGFASPPSGDAGGSEVLDAADGAAGIFDDDVIVLIALFVLLAATIGGAVYLISIAPHILSEAAFDFLLGTSLIRSYRRMNQPDWMGSVFRDTYKPFLMVMLVALGTAWVIHTHDPGITKISDLFAR